MDGDWLEKIDKFKLPIGLSVVGLVLIIGGIFASGINQSKPKQFPKESLVSTQKTVSVDVSGAVNKPGVYQLTEGSRIEEAIKAAGGFSDTANNEYISKYLNMAQKLSDGTKIYVPQTGEEVNSSQTGAVAGTQSGVKVNINTASQAQLEALPDIGSTRAAKIISGRQYSSIEELVSKKIISQSIFDKIKDSVSVY